MVGARSVGNLLLLLVGGVVADRLPRSVVLIASNLVAGGAQAGVALLVLTGSRSLVALIILSFVGGAAAAFDFPATTALVPQTVPPAALYRANAWLRGSLNGAMVGGAAVAGILVVAVGSGWALAIDAATFFVATICYSRVRVAVLPAGDAESPLRQFVAGWREFRSRTWVWVVVLAFFAINAAWVGGFWVLGLAVADDTIGRAAWGLVVAIEGAGMMTGVVLAARVQPRRPLFVGMLATALLAVPVLALAVAPRVAVLFPVAFVAGLAITQFGVAWETSLQRHIPPQSLARVSSFDALGSFAAIPAGELIVGPAADRFGTAPVLIVAAAVIAIGSAAALISRDVRRLT